jgi:hypothetical protein
MALKLNKKRPSLSDVSETYEIVIKSIELPTLEDGSPKRQLSKKELMEMIRPLMPDLIKRQIYLAYNAKSEGVQLKAIQALQNKVMPDLKSTKIDLSGEMEHRHAVRLPEKKKLDLPLNVLDGEIVE